MRVEVNPSNRYPEHHSEDPAGEASARTRLSEPGGPSAPPGQPDPADHPDPPGNARDESAHEGGIWSFISDALSALGSVMEGIVDALFGLTRSVAGLLTHPSKVPGELVENVSGAAILVGGKAVSSVQTLVGLEAAGRRLSHDELMALRRVFGDSIDFGRVRIKEGHAGLFSANARPFAHGNVIYTKDLPTTPELLAHELVHVWQYQNGGADYMAEALAAQALGDAYDWQRAVAEGKCWSEMGPEQQAELIGAAFSAGFFGAGELEDNRRFVVDGIDYTAFLRAALVELRAGRGAP